MRHTRVCHALAARKAERGEVLELAQMCEVRHFAGGQVEGNQVPQLQKVCQASFTRP